MKKVVPVGIVMGVRGNRVRHAVEPLLSAKQQSARLDLNLTLISDADGRPSGAGLSLTF